MLHFLPINYRTKPVCTKINPAFIKVYANSLKIETESKRFSKLILSRAIITTKYCSYSCRDIKRVQTGVKHMKVAAISFLQVATNYFQEKNMSLF